MCQEFQRFVPNLSMSLDSSMFANFTPQPFLLYMPNHIFFWKYSEIIITRATEDKRNLSKFKMILILTKLSTVC